MARSATPSKSLRHFAEQLQACPIFCTLALEEVVSLIDYGVPELTYRTRETPQHVITAGDFAHEGDSMYVILEGFVGIILGEENVLKLGPGQYFGEMSLLTVFVPRLLL